MQIVHRLHENVGVALDAMRQSKLRSALTVLGVVIGISTVMSMATLISGVEKQIIATIETAGPSTFYVFKVFSQTPLNPDALPAWVRIRPDLTLREATRLAQLPELDYASLWGIKIGRVEYRGERTQPNRIYGADSRFTEIIGGSLVLGRWFTRQEESSGAAVVVLNETYARRLFGRENPMEKTVRLGGRAATIVGLYAPENNVFQPPGVETAAVVPFRMLDQQFDIDRTNELFIAAKAKTGVSVAAAQEAATIAMRESRGLRPSENNTFDFVTQEQILDVFNKLTGAFFLVLLALSSVGLMVGGIGVMAIMMVSVTSRTREIGLRKAVGATRRDVLTQFLVEAATLTGLGGLFGIVAGGLTGQIIARLLDVPANTPVRYTIAAVTVSVGIGVIFGLIPARRAARLNPVDALRYE